MDSFMEYYFEEVFCGLDRDCLNEKYKRRELVEYFNTVIAGCAKGQNHTDVTSCKHFILAALKYHSRCKSNNGDVCLMGKFHNVLYIAIKLCFDWSVQENGVVAALLDELHACEKTFERIFLGAIFGTTAPYFLAGWKSDFKDREENVHALVYFLHHATNAKLEYTEEGQLYRFVDVPLECCGKASPVRVVIQMGTAEMLMILLRFGARISSDDNVATDAAESILDRLQKNNRQYQYQLVTCLKLILRATPKIKFTIDKSLFKHLQLPDDYNYDRRVALDKYGEMLEDHLIPSSRCGLRPVELKHLCRCVVRNALWQNFELPFGIPKLGVPMILQRYLDLFDD